MVGGGVAGAFVAIGAAFSVAKNKATAANNTNSVIPLFLQSDGITMYRIRET